MWKVKIATVKSYEKMYFKFNSLQSATNFIEDATEHSVEPLEFVINYEGEGEEGCTSQNQNI